MLILWKLLAIYFDSEFILPHPENIILKTFKLFADGDFLVIVGSTVIRGMVGFVVSLVMALVLGTFAGLNSSFYAFLQPILVTLRSTPVVAIILLALIWFSSSSVPIFIAIITMFPLICINIIDGIKNIDRQLVEMANIYRISLYRLITKVYAPAIIPFIFSGSSAALGIGWRAIIIGEVLSQPRFGIGTVMHSAQTFLNVDIVIAWTIIAVLISYIFERVIRGIQRKIVIWEDEE